MTDSAAQLAVSPTNGAPLANNRPSNLTTESQSPCSTTQPSSTGRSPKKRRKVNHACVYCRRSHMTCDEDRPCGRCLKRNIGHLCHDEPREPKKPKHEVLHAPGLDESKASSKVVPEKSSVNGMVEQQAPLAPPPMPPPRNTVAPQIVAPSPVSVTTRASLNPSAQAFLGLSDWDFLHSAQPTWFSNPYHQQWMFSANEAADEFTSMSDWVGNFQDDTNFFNDGSFFGGMNDMLQADPNDAGGSNSLTQAKDNASFHAMDRMQTHMVPPIARPASVKPTEKARENYYLTAADPTKDAPEERMKQVLRAKYQAGLLKPFNYVKGYARLGKFMENCYAPRTCQRIARQLDRFRPKFRERTQRLTDLDLVSVEEWFEKILMEYDRVFASMAVPACLWRRTGEIFRGNKEFAELIKVPIEHMRDGKLAIYELISEESFFCYWDKFGSIAFDTSQKAMLTTCQLRNPDPDAPNKFINCCFSFTIRRDVYDIPCAIVGNFIPIL